MHTMLFQLEKVLQQGDITEVAEPYMKDEKVNTFCFFWDSC